MKTVRILAAAMRIAGLFLSGIALADDDDHERARQAVESGKALPLSQLLDTVSGSIKGEVVGVEIEREQGRYYYELKIVSPEGKLREVLVDALTAEIVRNEED